MPRFHALSAVVLAGALALSGCKFIKTEDEQKAAAAEALQQSQRRGDGTPAGH